MKRVDVIKELLQEIIKAKNIRQVREIVMDWEDRNVELLELGGGK